MGGKSSSGFPSFSGSQNYNPPSWQSMPPWQYPQFAQYGGNTAPPALAAPGAVSNPQINVIQPQQLPASPQQQLPASAVSQISGFGQLGGTSVMPTLTSPPVMQTLGGMIMPNGNGALGGQPMGITSNTLGGTQIGDPQSLKLGGWYNGR